MRSEWTIQPGIDAPGYYVGLSDDPETQVWANTLKDAVELLLGMFETAQFECAGCKLKPETEGVDPFPEQCGECCRFYADHFQD
jgi:hypothetical protein